MKKIILSLSAPVIVAVTLFTCQRQGKETTPPANTALEVQPVAIKTEPVKPVNYSLPIFSSGLTSTKNEARLSFKVGGIIKKIFVEEGQSVQKGQILATLDLTEIDAQVSQARNNVEKLERDLARVKRLHADSAATLEMLQNTKTAFNMAEESFRIAEFNREYASIRATSSGKILRKLLNEGELASPGSPVFYMNSAGQDEWTVKLALADVAWVRIQKGDRVKLTTDAYPGEILNGAVCLIGEAADPFTGLYPVEVSVFAHDKKLATGLFMKAEIEPSHSVQLTQVPVESLVEGSGMEASVFVLQSDSVHVKRVAVKIAFMDEGVAYVASGLNGVRDVISSGSGFLTEASSIKISY
jgi:RND family efflux transporter MFP subunit